MSNRFYSNTFLIISLFFILSFKSGDESPLFLQEIDNFYIQISKDKVEDIIFVQKLGVGVHSYRGKKYLFDVNLKDLIEKSDKLIKPDEKIIKVATIYKTPFDILFSSNLTEKALSLDFSLKKAPAIRADKIGACCSCDGECGYACSVEFEYSARIKNFDPHNWAKVEFLSESDPIPVGRTSTVKGRILFENIKLKNAHYSIFIPRKIEGARLKVIKLPFGSEMVDSGAIFKITSPFLKDGFQDFEIEITPLKPGKISFKSFYLEAEFPELIYPAVKPDTSRKIEKLSYSKFIYWGYLEIDVK